MQIFICWNSSALDTIVLDSSEDVVNIFKLKQ